MLVKLDHFPKDRVEHKQILANLDLLVGCLEKVNQQYYPKCLFSMVMNTMGSNP